MSSSLFLLLVLGDLCVTPPFVRGLGLWCEILFEDLVVEGRPSPSTVPRFEILDTLLDSLCHSTFHSLGRIAQLFCKSATDFPFETTPALSPPDPVEPPQPTTPKETN